MMQQTWDTNQINRNKMIVYPTGMIAVCDVNTSDLK